MSEIAVGGPRLASIAFTAHLKAVGPGRPTACDGATLAEMLDAVAADYPRLKDYVLDDQGRLRKHIAVFIDGTLVPRDTALHRLLGPSAEVYVFQALSGG
jgi:sulfur carrier protein ThiS